MFLILSITGSIATYTPNKDYTGSDQFSFSTSGDSNTSIVTLNVFNNYLNSAEQFNQTINGNKKNFRIGTSVSFSDQGDILAIGSNEAKIHIYQDNGASWTILGKQLKGKLRDGFGSEVSLSGDGTTVATGAQYFDVKKDK